MASGLFARWQSGFPCLMIVEGQRTLTNFGVDEDSGVEGAWPQAESMVAAHVNGGNLFRAKAKKGTTSVVPNVPA